MFCTTPLALVASTTTLGVVIPCVSAVATNKDLSSGSSNGPIVSGTATVSVLGSATVCTSID